MKLRNKKTGEVFNFTIKSKQENMESYLLLRTGSGGWEDGLGYATLAELNAEWEDYNPAEPLIKDKKIRKAVRVWADFNGVEEVTYFKEDFGIRLAHYTISIDLYSCTDELENYKHYTITELCGEEEE